MATVQDKMKDKMYAVDAEQSLIGSVLIDMQPTQTALSVSYVKPGDFTHVTRRWAWEAIQACAQRGEVDIYLVADEMSMRFGVSVATAAADLLDMANTPMISNYAEGYASIVVRKSKMRELQLLATELAGKSESDDIDGTCQFMMQRLLSIMQSSGNLALTRDYGEACDDYCEKLYNLPTDASHLIKTGFRDVDRLVGGLNPGKLVIVAGRPSMGKSSFGNDMARRIAYTFKKAGSGTVLHISLEMTVDSIIERNIAARMGDVDTAFIRSGFRRENGEVDSDANGRAMDALAQERENFSGHLLVSEYAGLTMQNIATLAMQTPNLRVLVLDQLTNIQHQARDEYQRLSELIQSLKQLAMRQQIVVVCLTQIGRKVEDRQDKRPVMADIHGTGRIEQDADLIFGLYRPGYYYQPDDTDYDENAAYSHYAELLFMKNRDGEAGGMIPLWWNPRQVHYTDWPTEVNVESVQAYVSHKEHAR
jgi:replicative DNA helicase